MFKHHSDLTNEKHECFLRWALRPDHRDMVWGAKTKSQNHHKAGGHGTQYSQTERIYSGFNFLFPKEKKKCFISDLFQRYQRINYFSQNQARFYPVFTGK